MVLRQSDPCYGSLAPSRDRPSCHEYTYDPVTRYHNLAPTSFRKQRGTKSARHLELLRQSNPCYGSQQPVPRDKYSRCGAARSNEHGARSAKAFEHLAHIRQGFVSRPNANPKFDDDWEAMVPESSTIRAVSSISSEIWRRFEDDDQLPDLPSHGWPTRRGQSALRHGLEEISDLGSERSAGRTMERASNDTALSLADMDDIINNKAGFESGEWGSVPNSPSWEPSKWTKLEKARSCTLPSAQDHASSSQPPN